MSKISLFVLAQLANVTVAQTDRRTPGDGIYRAYAYASRGKNRQPFSRTAAHIFVSPGDAPGAITLNVVWMEREFDAYKLSRRIYPSISSKVSQLFKPQVQKIAIFTYRRPHFCFPWGRPWGNHAKCCMDGKRIRCLQLSRCMCPSNYYRF